MLKLKDVLKSDLCAGCGFCESASNRHIEMKYSSSGFLRPISQEEIDGKLSTRIEKVCPGVHGEDVVTDKNYNAESVHYMWGEYYSCGIGYSTNEKIRFIGSSGGAITQIAVWLLETGRVKGVLVTDYDAEDKIKTASKIAKNPQEVIASAGSKYAPSSPLSILSQIKDTDGPVAVIGKPCDITAMRRAIKSNDELAKNVYVLISFFCAGVPSDRQNEQLIKKLGVKNRSDLTLFRHRGNGWPGKTVAETVGGDRFECTYNESWGKTLNKDLQFRCKICPDGIGEMADIVCADAWYGDEGYPSFEEADGRSLIISRTKSGENLLNSCISDKKLEFEHVNADEIGGMQPGQLKRRQVLGIRYFAMRILLQKRFLINSYAVSLYHKGLGVGVGLIAFIGAVKRFSKRGWL